MRVSFCDCAELHLILCKSKSLVARIKVKITKKNEYKSSNVFVFKYVCVRVCKEKKQGGKGNGEG